MTGPRVPMTPEDSLRVEAYGSKGAAMRKVVATPHQTKKQKADSSLVKKVGAKVSNMMKHLK